MFASVEQHHGQSITELNTQLSVPGVRRHVDIGAGQLEVEFGGQVSQPLVHLNAQPTTAAGEQFHVRPSHPGQYPTVWIGLTVWASGKRSAGRPT